MDVLLNAVDMMSRVPVAGTEASNHGDDVYNESATSPKDTASDPITQMKGSSNHTQTISVASSEPSDDDESATTTSYPQRDLSVNGDDGRINWKNNPTLSYSDITIEVVVKSTHDTMPHVFNRPSGNPDAPVPKNKLRSYHVHRSVLAYGQRRSLYFVKLFQKNYAHSNDDVDEEQLYRNCRIYLTKDVAKAFPSLLEYMYATDEEAYKVVTSENVIPLHFLSKILQITCLRAATEQFYEGDMSVLNCYRYYREAHALNGQKIMKAVTNTVINNLSKIKLQSDLLTDFNALSLWKHVVQSKHRANSVNESIQISTLIACFCKLHRKVLQKDDFIRLTDVRYMPVIHYQVALPLLEISKDLRTTETTGTLNRLQIRCLDAFVQSWKVWMTNPTFAQTLSKLDVFELYYLLNSALNSSEEKAPLIRSIRKHQAEMNQQKEQGSDEKVAVRKSAPPRAVVPRVAVPRPKKVKRPPASSPPRTQASSPAPTPQQAPFRAPQQVQQAPLTAPQRVQQAPRTAPQRVQQAPRTAPQQVQQAPRTAPQPVQQQAPRTAPQPAHQQAPFHAQHYVQQAPRTTTHQVQQAPCTAPQPAQQQAPFHAPQHVQQAPLTAPQQASCATPQPAPHQAPFHAPHGLRFASQHAPSVAVLQGSPHHHQQSMNIVAIPIHAAPMTMNSPPPQPVILHPIQYQQLLQQRENAWNDYRKRKQMDAHSDPNQLAVQVVAQAAQQPQVVQHQQAVNQQQIVQQQQQYAKRFRPNIPYHPFPAPQPQPYYPQAPWQGWVQK